ncbi:hypothetical protein [Rhodohalobacter barkolensis]|uniref:POTRA domain-containing protein n=1 Tax=Rhodohalobacter barkolensis TaxID=2053187 RepID=A0A2N0VGN1_9BACT|nr:hypothetical protein [Rhodohalobacter barkolensis]PKD43308.1 hypothetical protein CWD77_11900 [Rhodohalobacter barkolensis]
MVHLLKTLFIILISISSGLALAQDAVNIIPCDDYEAIKFNGKTIEQLNATNAESQNVQRLLGNYSSVEELSENRSRSFNYVDFRIGFTYDIQTYVTRITITSNQWPVVIQGNTVKVGDTIDSLKQAFGNDLIIGESQYVSYSFIAFRCTEKDTGVILEIDPNTNTITEIVYFVSP